ncbi:MAG TPA: ABC transporter permease [Terriglobales bacterium]|nr:ABC transporter permease [Terriglobales bacterium]
MSNPFRGFYAVFAKEFLHMRRDSTAMVFALIMPLVQMTILGAAIDTNVRQVKTVVYDASGVMERAGSTEGSEQSRAFVDRFRNSDTFRVYKYVHSDQDLNAEMVSGRARVGLKIPFDFERRLLRGETAQVLVLVDGSDSSVAGQAVNVSGAIGLDESLQRMLPPNTQVPVEIRPKVMFNPDSRSPNFFLPGLMAVLLLFVTTMLTAFAIVREKERGTLEQLLITPVKPLGLMMGKLLPYFSTGLTEMTVILLFMRFIFQVPIHGDVVLLVLLAMTYIFVNLALGLLISSRANSQVEAMQLAMGIMLPSIFLSGYIFPRDTMPLIFRGVSYLVPATYMLEISRGVILRGAGLLELWRNATVLLGMGAAILMLAAYRFKRIVV